MITGASKGLGYEIAKYFLKFGSNLMICSRNDIQIRKAYKKLNKTYKEILVETIERKSGTSKAVTLKNILNVCRSIMIIFLNQMICIQYG